MALPIRTGISVRVRWGEALVVVWYKLVLVRMTRMLVIMGSLMVDNGYSGEGSLTVENRSTVVDRRMAMYK